MENFYIKGQFKGKKYTYYKGVDGYKCLHTENQYEALSFNTFKEAEDEMMKNLSGRIKIVSEKGE